MTLHLAEMGGVIRHHLRVGGLKGMLRKSAMRLRDLLWSESSWLILEVDDQAITEMAAASSLEHRHLTTRSLATLGYEKAIVYPDVIDARLAKGEICHGFFRKGDFVHVAWTASGYLPLARALPSLKYPGTWGIYDCSTLPAFRGQGVYHQVLITLIDCARQSGCAKTVIAVDPTNTISLRVIERAGFARRASVSVRKRIGFRSIRYEEIS